MQRIGEAGGLFIAGDPSTNTKGTIVTAAWLNAIQEELANVVEKTFLTLDPNNSAQVWAALRRLVPAGFVAQFAMTSLPPGWLKANGAEISRTVYADLFAVIGTFFGAGNGTTTFKLPDLRGEFLRGWDDGRGIDTGRVFGSTQTDQNKLHNHSVYYANTLGSSLTYASMGTANTTFSSTTGDSGGSEARPRNIALLTCIKY